jgi:16S rRNA processing protein RimM
MDLLAVGVIRAAHGVRGELRVRSFSGDNEGLLKLRRVVARKRGVEKPLDIAGSRNRPPDVLLRVAGVETREEAQRLVGFELWAERASAAPLAAGEYYEADLCRCRLFFADELIGSVRSVVDTGAAPLLEISRPDGASVLVPFVEHFIGEVDVAGGRIALKEDYVVR